MINELERNMIKAITKSKEHHPIKVDKKEQKYWGAITVPFSLEEGLTSYTKTDLDKIRKRLKIKNASGLKKAELVALFQEKIPGLVEDISRKWDATRFNLLTTMAHQNGYMITPKLKADQIEYLRETGLVYTGSQDGEKILALPVELIDEMKSLETNEQIASVIKRNTEWIKMTKGLLYFYGTIRLEQLKDMIVTLSTESFDMDEFMSVLEEAITYEKEMKIDTDIISHRRVSKPQDMLEKQGVRTDITYYPFSKPELIAAGEEGYVEENKGYAPFVSFLINTFHVENDEANQIVAECIYGTKQGATPNQVLQYVSNEISFSGLDNIQVIMDYIAPLMNHTRKWELKGYTTTELGTKEKQLLPKNTSKIGRNDPCLCGSNKKYKKCCGK